MNNLWNYFKNLFTQAEKSSPTVPFIHETLERSETEKIAYEKWQSSLIKRRLLNWLHEQYVVFLNHPEQVDDSIDFLHTPSSNGFVIHFSQTRYSNAEIMGLFDYFQQKTRSFNYKNYLSDRRIFTRNQRVEMIERHYLKPRPDFSAPQMEQLFGNVTIELLFQNDQAVQLKFSATHYQDKKYLPPQPFQNLLTTLTEM